MEQIPSILPVLPIRNVVVFPSISVPLVVGRPRSIRALEATENSSNFLIVVCQKPDLNAANEPHAEDLFQIGTLCKLENTTVTDMGNRQVVVTGIARFRILEYLTQPAGHLRARGEIVSDAHGADSVRNDALFYNLKTLGREILELIPGVTEPVIRLVEKVDDATYLTHLCAAYLNLEIPQKQKLLETENVEERMETLLSLMRNERDVLNLQKEIREKMSERLSKAQREALLREQLRTIHSELGDESGEEAMDELEKNIFGLGLPELALKQAKEELRRLKSLPSASAEYHVIRSYLEWIAALPWNQKSELILDLDRARRTLDEDHYGLESVKRRILQFLAVAKLKQDLHGPILCLVGPPGVGKTSLGQSIARALGLKFTRTSLGGVRDEAEIRGHRRTYVGAMPGRILQGMKRVGVRNPVMLLDEIDKLRADFHGDPSSAMLEVLDPEQNKTFTDHYLDLPFDLSDVFFLCTANQLDTIPAPLRDRMEMIEVNGYTFTEKLNIAKKYLMPKMLIANGIKADWIEIPDDTLLEIITHYTREAGVRELERKIAALMRAVAEEFVKRDEENVTPIRITIARLFDYLGPEKFFPELADRAVKAGLATALAWTPHGGDLLFIEAATIPKGKGQLTLTGQIGEVMKESAQIALSLARTLTLEDYNGNDPDFDFNSNDIHIHVPAGAIPKDGPSAGVTILAALISLMTGRTLPISLAMTGEITLRGAVLAVGGIKEKVLAAHRAGLKKIILPYRNAKDLLDVPEDVRNQVQFVFVKTVEEMMASAFTHPKELNIYSDESTPLQKTA